MGKQKFPPRCEFPPKKMSWEIVERNEGRPKRTQGSGMDKKLGKRRTTSRGNPPNDKLTKKKLRKQLATMPNYKSMIVLQIYG